MLYQTIEYLSILQLPQDRLTGGFLMYKRRVSKDVGHVSKDVTWHNPVELRGMISLNHMQEAIKKQLLEKAKERIAYVRERITQVLAHKENQTTRMAKESIKMLPGDAIAQRRIVAHNQEKIENLKQLYPSPYFTRCDFEINGEKRELYFGKFSFSEEGIYSWITPAATLRFENPGKASYIRPDGAIRSGVIERKDQYMIVDGKLLFFSTETIGKSRELVHQEHFTRQKQGFILPEVVEQMEKAQDQVIRAHHQGPFVISGPAGSGKTTLALHRVAYLMQSPETMEYFQPETILVLVQDSGTKEYFSHLLPNLGITGVSIVTFAEWAASILKLTDYSPITNYGEFNQHKALYEYAKLQALRSQTRPPYNKSAYSYLEKMYSNFLTSEQKKIFSWQKKEKLLDRFDITLLLEAHEKKFGSFTFEREYYEELANGNYRKRAGSFPVRYNLMIIDEFQNYLPEQLRILKTCVNNRLRSIVYVGDIAQQTQLGTIRNWESLEESVREDRLVKLQKVYRNTKEILSYIKSLGYPVEVPDQLRSGKSVKEIVVSSSDEEIQYIKNQLVGSDASTIGILAKDSGYLDIFKQHFKENSAIHCLSYYEAQGVEFDAVCIVGVGSGEVEAENYPEELRNEIQTVEKDLLYVALTRAMSELHVLGRVRLEKIVESGGW